MEDVVCLQHRCIPIKLTSGLLTSESKEVQNKAFWCDVETDRVDKCLQQKGELWQSVAVRLHLSGNILAFKQPDLEK